MGALFSCSTALHLRSDKQEFPTDSASSAKILLTFPGTSTPLIHSSASSTLAVEEKAGSSPTIREVFCRALPPQRTTTSVSSNSTTESTPNPIATTVGNSSTLRGALGRLYDGLRVVSSPQPSVAGAKWRGNGEAMDEEGERTQNAAQPQLLLGAQLETCSRLHAGLVPLYTPLVESEDGIFLVRRPVSSG